MVERKTNDEREELFLEREREREGGMAKHSTLDPQAPNFSLLNASHSQVLGTAGSLSIPSEPPDISNWFSSYVYESPELNSDFQGYGLRGSGCVEEGFNGEEKNQEKEENFGEFQKISNKNDYVLADKVVSIGFVKSNNTVEDQNRGNKQASQVLCSSDSLSLSSEPPDITRWFSSYVYESPLLDTSNDFRNSVSTESEHERVASDAENCSKVKGENLTEFTRTTKNDVLAADEIISSSGLDKCNSNSRDNHHDYPSTGKDIHGVEGSKMSSGQVLQGKTTTYYDSDSTQNEENPSLDGQVSIGKTEMNREADSMPLTANGNSSRKIRKSLKESTQRRHDPAETRKPTPGSNDKENDGNIFAENGFVSTRNERRERTNDGSYLERPVEVQLGCLRNERVPDSSVVLRRKPLSETTNIFQQAASSLEITGKWKCPQKRKPDLGPPLKQLRLEQWVHRE